MLLRALAQLLFLALLATPCTKATPLSVVHTVNDLWNALATGAAKETIKAVKLNTGMDMDLQSVPMDTFQVMVGRQHHLGLEVEGVTYNLLLGNEAEALEQARQRAYSPSSPSSTPYPALAKALPASSGASGVASGAGVLAPLSTAPSPLQLLSGPGSRRSLELPETTLMGPLELVLRVPEPVAIYAPLAADVGGPVRRVVLEAGVTVGVAGLKRVKLRRPLELARLPGQYLAEVWAQGATGAPEEGFATAPGITYLAEQLRKAALEVAANRSSSSNSSGRQRSQQQQQQQLPLLALDIETVTHGSLIITSMPDVPPPYAAAAAPKLKVRRTNGGTVELSLRKGQVAAPSEAPVNPAALSRTWAWPLPHSDSSAWMPYETLLRSVLASHPFNVDSVIRRGIGLRLTRSTIQGVHLITFDMEVRARRPRPPELEEAFEWNEKPLEVWEAVVQVQSQSGQTSATSSDSTRRSDDDDPTGSSSPGSSPGSSYHFVPLHVKHKQSYQNTLTMSRSAVLLALTGGRNESLVGRVAGDGYDQVDLGMAANAP